MASKQSKELNKLYLEWVAALQANPEMPLDELRDDPHAKACACLRLGSKEGFEETAQRGAIHSDACIGNGRPHPRDASITPIARWPQANRNLSGPLRHRFN